MAATNMNLTGIARKLVMDNYLDFPLARATLFSLEKLTQARRPNLDELGRAKFALLASLNHPAIFIDQLDLDMRMNAPNG